MPSNRDHPQIYALNYVPKNHIRMKAKKRQPLPEEWSEQTKEHGRNKFKQMSHCNKFYNKHIGNI